MNAGTGCIFCVLKIRIFEGQFMIVGCSLMSIALRHDCLPKSQILTAHKIFITEEATSLSAAYDTYEAVSF